MNEPASEPVPFDPRAHTMRLQGKPYLNVAGRIDWFNSEHVSFQIDSEIIELTDTHAVFRAKVTTLSDGGVIIATATAHGSESKADFGDYIEKAETKALGRALGRLGYGTPEEDGAAQGRPVDTPRDFPNPAEGERCPMGHRMKDGPYGLNCTGKLPDGSWHNWKPVPPREPPPPPPPRATKAELAAAAKAEIAARATPLPEDEVQRAAQGCWEAVKQWAAEHGTERQRLRYYLGTPKGVPEKVNPAAFRAWLDANPGLTFNELYERYTTGETEYLENAQLARQEEME